MTLFIALTTLLSILFGRDEAEIVFAGDAMMHQAQIDAAKRPDGSFDFSEYFQAIDTYTATADYAVVNLETPVSAPPYSGYPCFNSPPQYIDALVSAGFDLFLTANNHTLDRHDRGLRSTIKELDDRRLDHIGTYISDSVRVVSTPLIKNINGIKVAFINYTYGTNGINPGPEVVVDYIDRNRIAADIKQARTRGAEFIFACIHWGNEYRQLPHFSQKELAEFLFEHGVNAIIGCHPHVVQPFELHDNRLLIYSLGNFISNMKTRDTRGGALVKVTLRRADDGLIEIADATYRMVFTEPADINHNFRLQWVDKSEFLAAKQFAQSARALFKAHNVNVTEDLPR